MSRPQCHSAAGRIKSMKNPTDPIEDRTLDLSVCSAVKFKSTHVHKISHHPIKYPRSRSCYEVLLITKQIKLILVFHGIAINNYKITCDFPAWSAVPQQTAPQRIRGYIKVTRPPPPAHNITQQPLVGQGLLKFKVSSSHSIWHITLDRVPLAQVPTRRRDLYLTTHNMYKRQTSTNTAVFETTIRARQQPQTQASNRAATEIGLYHTESVIIRLDWQTIWIRLPNEENTSYTTSLSDGGGVVYSLLCMNDEIACHVLISIKIRISFQNWLRWRNTWIFDRVNLL